MRATRHACERSKNSSQRKSWPAERWLFVVQHNFLMSMQQSFQAFDRDRSGSLDRGEVFQALQHAGAPPGPACKDPMWPDDCVSDHTRAMHCGGEHTGQFARLAAAPRLRSQLRAARCCCRLPPRPARLRGHLLRVRPRPQRHPPHYRVHGADGVLPAQRKDLWRVRSAALRPHHARLQPVPLRVGQLPLTRRAEGGVGSCCCGAHCSGRCHAGFRLDQHAFEALFAAFDPDRSQGLSLTEYMGMTTYLQMATQMFSAFDPQRQGRITLDFNQWIYAASNCR